MKKASSQRTSPSRSRTLKKEEPGPLRGELTPAEQAVEKISRAPTAPRSRPPKKEEAGTRKVELTQAEREILIRICTEHKVRLPCYLLACQVEIQQIEELIRKLS